MLVMDIGADPVLATVTVWAAVVTFSVLLNDSAVGVTLAAGLTPVPVNVTICGLVTSESVMVSVPVRTPVVVGRKLTLMRQLRPAFSVVPQLFESEKFVLQAMLLTEIGVVPTFDSVTVWFALRVPTSWLPNSSELVLRLRLLTS